MNGVNCTSTNKLQKKNIFFFYNGFSHQKLAFQSNTIIMSGQDNSCCNVITTNCVSNWKNIKDTNSTNTMRSKGIVK